MNLVLKQSEQEETSRVGLAQAPVHEFNPVLQAIQCISGNLVDVKRGEASCQSFLLGPGCLDGHLRELLVFPMGLVPVHTHRHATLEAWVHVGRGFLYNGRTKMWLPFSVKISDAPIRVYSATEEYHGFYFTEPGFLFSDHSTNLMNPDGSYDLVMDSNAPQPPVAEGSR